MKLYIPFDEKKWKIVAIFTPNQTEFLLEVCLFDEYGILSWVMRLYISSDEKKWKIVIIFIQNQMDQFPEESNHDERYSNLYETIYFNVKRLSMYVFFDKQKKSIY